LPYGTIQINEEKSKECVSDDDIYLCVKLIYLCVKLIYLLVRLVYLCVKYILDSLK